MKPKKQLVLIRSGECKRCGDCCNIKKLSETVAMKDVTKSDSLKELLDNKDSSEVFCSEFEVRDKSGFCKLFGKAERPLICIDHPGSPNSLTSNCGYIFTFKRVSNAELKRLKQDSKLKVYERVKKETKK